MGQLSGAISSFHQKVRNMPFILFLLALFMFGCILYGIFAGVRGLQRGISWLSNSLNTIDQPEPESTSLTQLTVKAESTKHTFTKIPPPSSSSISELREIFSLHQQGALTQKEFQDMKQYLLSSLQPKPDIY